MEKKRWHRDSYYDDSVKRDKRLKLLRKWYGKAKYSKFGSGWWTYWYSY